MIIDKRTDLCSRVGDTPGRYLLSRDLVIDGQPYGAEIECTNPAVGTRSLDYWERETVELLHAAKHKRGHVRQIRESKA